MPLIQETLELVMQVNLFKRYIVFVDKKKITIGPILEKIVKL